MFSKCRMSLLDNFWWKKIMICKMHFWSRSGNIIKKRFRRRRSPLEPLKKLWKKIFRVICQKLCFSVPVTSFTIFQKMRQSILTLPVILSFIKFSGRLKKKITFIIISNRTPLSRKLFPLAKFDQIEWIIPNIQFSPCNKTRYRAYIHRVKITFFSKTC